MDLDIVNSWTCCSNLDWERQVKSSKGGEEYTVRFGLLPPGLQSKLMQTHGYSCTCPAFKFSKKRMCKHISGVMSERCAWNVTCEPTLTCDHDVNGEPCCPECGGPVTSVQVGV